MVSSTNPGIAYQYDGHRRRVQKTEGGQTSYTVYGQNGKLLHKLKGGVSTHYIYAGSLLIAKKEGSTVHYLHTDLLGSPIKGDNGPATLSITGRGARRRTIQFSWRMTSAIPVTRTMSPPG